jgi:crotonobetainyl-CoA:carnitine CoA-transferase CaiB-like acyl-CoA transferase
MHEAVHASLGTIPIVPQPVRFSDCSRPTQMRVPLLGEDTEAVLGSALGMDKKKIAELRAAKAI